MDSAVQSHLRPTETARAVLETAINNGKADKRVLAVISHADDVHGRTEGSLFIFRVKSTNNAAELVPVLVIQRVFPIDDEFNIQMAQAKPSHQETLEFVSTPGSSFILTINPGEDDHAEPIVLLSDDIQGIKKLMSEYRTLKETAIEAPTSPLQTFSWLSSYSRATGKAMFTSSSLVPQDLRTLQRPLHARLTSSSAGDPGDDVSDIILVRDHWLREQVLIKSRIGQRRLRLKLGTFNVNGVLPSQDLSSWLGGPGPNEPQKSSSEFTPLPPLKNISPFTLEDKSKDPFDSEVEGDVNPDIIVLGFQELDLSTEALLYSTKTVREEAWCTAVFAALGDKAELYEKLASKQLVGILIVVLVRKSLRECFGEVQTCYAGVGVLGIMGNKGGTAVRMLFTPTQQESEKYLPTTFTFVNSHLAAFDEMYERRNSDFQDLSRRLGFPLSISAHADPSPTPAPPMELLSVFESDVLFWMGDLNYRLNLPDTDVRAILASKSWSGKHSTLLQYDQLKSAQKSDKAFVYFKEHDISHLPTYRFSPGVLTDEMGYDIKRKPAWTDRILHMHDPTVSVTQTSCQSYHEIRMSDHKPVSADFLVDINTYSSEQFKLKAKELSRRVMNMDETSRQPSLKTGASTVQLGKMRRNRSASAVFTVQNTGKIPSVFRFISPEANTKAYPDWMRVEPLTGLLLPNEVVEIVLSTTIDDKLAANLNLGPKQLNATLILHTAHGKDHFITVEAIYEYTCFANKLSRLVRLPGPARSMKSSEELLEESKSLNAPRELMRVVNWLMSSQANADSLFSSVVEKSLMEEITECLDTDKPFSQGPENADHRFIAAFAEILLCFLASLPEAVIPASLHAQCGLAQTREEGFELLDTFPTVSVNVWISVTAFLHFICQKNKGEAERLASIFAPVFFKEPDSLAVVSPLAKRNFTLLFITD